MDIVTALSADQGLVCVVGAGGKKTTLYSLASQLERAVVTATVRIPIFDGQVADVIVTEDPERALSDHTAWPVGVVPEREDNRYLGYDPAVVDDLHAGTDVPILVKADGARTRLFKAPNDGEPRVPSTTDVVIPIASAHVVGEPLTEDAVHRVERVAAITGLPPGDPVTAEAVGRVIASPHGGHKDVPDGATVIPLINMVDDAALADVGRDIADAIHRRADVPHVVLAAMREPDPLVEIV